MTGRTPKRPKQHVTGDRATRVFESRCRPEWTFNEAKSDYGWDYIVTIVREQYVEEDFLAQVKGSDNPEYVDRAKFLSLSLKVATVTWLHEKPMPSMVAVCDTGNKDEPIYWIWVSDAVQALQRSRPEWQNQESVTIRIPTSQTLSEDNWDKIEAFVRNFFERKRIATTLFEMIEPAYPPTIDLTGSGLSSPPRDYITENIVPSFRAAGILETYEAEMGEKHEALSSEDQKRSRILDDVILAIREFRENDARRLLDSIEGKIDTASHGIRARYLNNRGVLALRADDNESARGFFRDALALRSSEPKYMINLLACEFYMAIEKPNGLSPLPKDWETRLSTLLEKCPDYPPAVRLKSQWLARVDSSEEAERFLKESPAWNKEPLECRICLAMILRDCERLDEALAVLDETPNINCQPDGTFWSLHGGILFDMALSSKREVFFGYGPAGLNVDLLQKALQSYERATQFFVSRGLPRVAEESIIRTALITHLLAAPQRIEAICASYLKQYPDHIGMLQTLGLVLFDQQRFAEARPYLERVFERDPASDTAYQNLITCLNQIEEFEQLLKVIAERESTGFKDATEESISRTYAAMAFCGLGEMEHAQEQVGILYSNPATAGYGVIAEVQVRRLKGDSEEDFIRTYQRGIQQYPNDSDLLAHYARALAPPTKENAKDILRCLHNLAQRDQLSPEELALVGHAYLALDQSEEAYRVFSEGMRRFPFDTLFAYRVSLALSLMGDDDGAWQYLQIYFKQHGEHKYQILRNAAAIAYELGKFDEATKMLSRTLSKTQDSEIRGQIHWQLYELKKICKASPREIMRHAMEYGKTTEGRAEEECRFLMLFLLSPEIPDAEKDNEVKEWIKEAGTRLEKFVEGHPEYPRLMAFKMPEQLSDTEAAEKLLTELATIFLPHYLAVTPIVLAARSQSLPLPFRAKFLPGPNSIFDFWKHCIRSDDFSHAIHIWRDSNDLNAENIVAAESRKICVDITALLTLAELNLLEALNSTFDTIVISRETKMALDEGLQLHGTRHPLAEHIESWRLNNRAKIRVRSHSPDEQQEFAGRYSLMPSGLWVPARHPLNQVIGEGVGETLLLSEKLGLPYYSDDSCMREWAVKEHNVRSFSTISLLNRLAKEGRLSRGDHLTLLAKMIAKNFRTIPINANGLYDSLDVLRKKTFGVEITKHDIDNDPILGTFLRQFGDTSLNIPYLAKLAIEWWLLILLAEQFSHNVLVTCMESPSFSLSMRTTSGVLWGIDVSEQDKIFSAIWVGFLWRTFREHRRSTKWAFAAIKDCASRLFPCDETKRDRIVFQLLPRNLLEVANSDMSLTRDERLDFLISLPNEFDHNDRVRFENILWKLVPNKVR